ncbi:MAG: HdeA/HdeB family chaperone [Succinivibrio sp.]
MKRALMIIGLAVAMTGGSFAVNAAETDVAQVKCSEFIQDQEGMGMILMWLDGYASQKSGNTVLSNEWIEKLGAHMGKYCSENPNASILEAAQAME